jgi:hypothetical protein
MTKCCLTNCYQCGRLIWAFDDGSGAGPTLREATESEVRAGEPGESVEIVDRLERLTGKERCRSCLREAAVYSMLEEENLRSFLEQLLNGRRPS